jgi:hypothetical protein
MKYIVILLICFVSVNTIQGQEKVVFKKNLSFTIPAGWFLKDSSANRIMLRKTGDIYSKIEIKIYDEKEPNLIKYTALDKKKFFPDKHIKTVLPDGKLGNRMYKKIKYVNNKPVVIANSELEYVIQYKPKVIFGKTPMARLETIVTYNNKQEATFIKETEALIASFKL